MREISRLTFGFSYNKKVIAEFESVAMKMAREPSIPRCKIEPLMSQVRKRIVNISQN